MKDLRVEAERVSEEPFEKEEAGRDKTGVGEGERSVETLQEFAWTVCVVKGYGRGSAQPAGTLGEEPASVPSEPLYIAAAPVLSSADWQSPSSAPQSAASSAAGVAPSPPCPHPPRYRSSPRGWTSGTSSSTQVPPCPSHSCYRVEGEGEKRAPKLAQSLSSSSCLSWSVHLVASFSYHPSLISRDLLCVCVCVRVCVCVCVSACV